MWMFSYKFMHMAQSGLRAGTTDIPTDSVSPMGHQPYGFMMTPTKMTMDMHMLMAMVGVTDRFTVMAMSNYQAMVMDMLMNMGSGNVPQSPMRTSGFGDTELRGIYGIWKYLVGSLGLGIPTGSTTEEIDMMGITFRAPYDMQLGSGTFELRPALTFNMLSDSALWNFGAQASGVYHIASHHGYSRGDNFKFMGWVQRALGPAATWLRLVFNDTGRISGRDPEIDEMQAVASAPDGDPNNYGGQRIDAALGVAVKIGPFSFGVEGGLPLYENLNGLQLKTSWFLNSGFQTMF
jgi:hypothetical protein